LKASYNIKEIERIAAEGKLKSLGVFIIMKHRYRNGVIYNYTIKGLASEFGHSRVFIKKMIDFYIDSGWCVVNGRNLIFTRHGKLDKPNKFLKYKIDVFYGITLKEVLYDLRLAILKRKQANLDYLKSIERCANRPTNLKSHKWALKSIKRMGLKRESLPPESANLKVSMSGFAKMFGCSRASAHGIVKSFKKAQDVFCYQGFAIQFMRTSNPAIVKSILGAISGTYYRDGVVYKTQCNQYFVHGV
jgi:hypothetical protein